MTLHALPVATPTSTLIPPLDDVPKRLRNTYHLRQMHEYIRLLTAYANGPQRAVFLLRLLPLLQRPQRRKAYPVFQRTLLFRLQDPTTELPPFRHDDLLKVCRILHISPQMLCQMWKPQAENRIHPDYDWEIDAQAALLYYAHREPLTLFYELLVLMSERSMSLSEFARLAGCTHLPPSSHAAWAKDYLKDLTREDRLQTALTLLELSAEELVGRLPRLM